MSAQSPRTLRVAWPSDRHKAGFTLVELMVVMAILAVLVTLAVVVGQRFMNSAKARDTGAMLNVVKTAVDQFALDAPYKNVVAARNRYGMYPPDELDAFTPPPPTGTMGIPIPTNGGTPVWSSANLSTRPGSLQIPGGPSSLANVKQRDVKAMMLAIRLQGGTAAGTLEGIDKRFLARAIPGEYFDADGVANPSTAPRPEDTPLDWLIDGWENPVEYFAVNARGFPAGGPMWVDLATDPTGQRRLFSSAAVQRNNGVPFLVSYGPDGADQLQGSMPITLVSDWNDTSPGPPNVIDDPLNADNVYSDEALTQKLAGAP